MATGGPLAALFAAVARPFAFHRRLAVGGRDRAIIGDLARNITMVSWSTDQIVTLNPDCLFLQAGAGLRGDGAVAGVVGGLAAKGGPWTP